MGGLFARLTIVVCCFGSALAEPLEDAAVAYERGDFALAAGLILPYAEAGNAEAQYKLGVLHDNGRGVPQDYAQANKWYHAAAEQGHPSAQYNLGRWYTIGLDIPQDYVQAYKWLELAAAGFPLSDLEGRSSGVRIRDSITAIMTPTQIAEVKNLAHEWRPR